MTTVDFVNNTTQLGFGGDNQSINKRLDNTYNQWTRAHDDSCAYVNEVRILRKPLKYYVNRVWAPAPTNQSHFSTYTAVGNQKAYDVSGNLTYPGIGAPTTLGNKRYLEYIQPFNTSPDLGNNAINVTDIDVNSNQLTFGIGEPTNLNILTKDVTTATDYNRWSFVDPSVVQNPKNIIFADGVIPVGGISTRNELRNYASLNSC
jgi:hypothetical protein